MFTTVERAACFIAGLGLMVTLARVVPGRALPPARQPLEFNHKKHVAADWACGACHPHTDQEAYAGTPGAKVCVDCHESEADKYPDNKRMAQMTDRLRGMLKKGEEIHWARVHRTAGHVYFSHRRHVEEGALKCEACHGDMASVTEPVSRPAFPAGSRDKMAWCTECHRHKGVTTDCAACHR